MAIDQSSLARYGRWPWSRDLDARLLDAICHGHPRAVGVDVAFAENDPQAPPDANVALQRAIKECGKVVLPVVIELKTAQGGAIVLPPVAELADAAAGLGRVGVVTDADGVGRSVYLWEGLGMPRWPTLAQVMLQHVQAEPNNPPAIAWPLRPMSAPSPVMVPPAMGTGRLPALVATGQRWLNFVGHAGKIPTVSAARLLEHPDSARILQGKLVLLGATAAGMGDFIATPATTQGSPMPGVEILANVLIDLRDHATLQKMGVLNSTLINALLAGIPLLWLPRLMPLPGLLISVLWVLCLVLLPVQAFVTHVIVPVSGALLAGVLAYPVWGWLRLEAARRHLDAELAVLSRQTGYAVPKRMGFEQRLTTVQAAQQQLQRVQQQREDMLAFISHDIRVPLASAVQLLQAEQPDHLQMKRLRTQLQHAHELAQNFIAVGRAEALDVGQFAELDVLAVLEQAVDLMYDAAQQQRVQLVRAWPDEPVWVCGDAPMLERAILNILSNALRYTPEEGKITISAAEQDDQLVIEITDSGSGIAPDVLPNLFGRYQQGARSNVAAGVGLGLYFVWLVMSKHQGQVSAHNSHAGGACFTLRLPLHVCQK